MGNSTLQSSPNLLYDTNQYFIEKYVGGVSRSLLGISPLSDVLDIVISLPVDYMHAVFEGVVEKW